MWEEKHERAFLELKRTLKESVELFQPDFSKPFILETDASKTGISGILSQEYDGIDSPIAFTSRKLVQHEVKHSTSEKECLAMLWSMEHFKYFLHVTEFTLITDHKALECLNTGEIKSLKIQRLMDRLANLGYEVKYKKGSEIPHVDCLSRNCVNEMKDNEDVNKEITDEQKEGTVREFI
jgi:hypothetical protein